MNTGPDHLDESPSECVRRHAATFRSVREHREARESREAADADVLARAEGSGDGLSDEDQRVAPYAVTGDGLVGLGARAAARLVSGASAAGWRVHARAARGRRRGTGPWGDSVAVTAGWGEPDALSGWVLGIWRADEPGKFKFEGGQAWDRERGTRSVGARELTALMTSPMR